VGPELRQRLYARIAASETDASEPPRATLRNARSAEGHPLARAHGPRVATSWLSGVAAALLVALLVGMFWALPRLRQQNHTSKKVVAKVTTACPASKTTADLSANVALNDLAMTSATDGWAVGEIIDAQGQTAQGVILRYSECHWSQVALNLKDVSLTHISMDSPTDGWASGQLIPYSDGFILLHYTGGAWSVVPASQRPANTGMVNALSMRTPDEGWLATAGPDNDTNSSGSVSVAASRVWHDIQGSWTKVASPTQMIDAIAPVGPDDLWIAGSDFVGAGKQTSHSFAHYHNGAWSIMPQPAGLWTESLHANSPTDIWASGIYSNGFGAVVHYDGVAWRIAPDAVSALPTPALSPGSTLSPTDPIDPALHGGEFSGVVTITGDGAGWAYDWKPSGIMSPGSQAVIANLYREDGDHWQSLNWPYSDIGVISSWVSLPDGEVWATGTWQVPRSETTPLPGGGGTTPMSFSAYLLHYVNGEWSRYITTSNIAN
jgi:hypothetical protein